MPSRDKLRTYLHAVEAAIKSCRDTLRAHPYKDTSLVRETAADAAAVVEAMIAVQSALAPSDADWPLSPTTLRGGWPEVLQALRDPRWPAGLDVRLLRLNQRLGGLIATHAARGPFEPQHRQLERLPSQLVPSQRQDLLDSLDAVLRDLKGSAKAGGAPTIWFHNGMSYSVDRRTPQLVSHEVHNILKAFLGGAEAIGTAALEHEGVNNVTKAMGKIEKLFGPGAVRRPGRKGDGYYIRVRRR
jgi:hypothetical protein